MAITTFKRYEKKFMLNEAQYKAVMPGLMEYMRLDRNCKDGRDYTIYNIYYDTDNSSIIRQSLSKPYYKEKLRMRSYSVPTSPDSEVFLELKKKIGGIVNKRRAVLTLGEAYKFLESVWVEFSFGSCHPGASNSSNAVAERVMFRRSTLPSHSCVSDNGRNTNKNARCSSYAGSCSYLQVAFFILHNNIVISTEI